MLLYHCFFFLSYSWLFFLQLFSCWITTCISGSCSLRNRGLGLVKTSGSSGHPSDLQHLHRHANLHLASNNKGHHSHHVTNHLGKRQLANLDPWIFSYFWTTKSYTNIVVNDSSIFSGQKKSESCYFHETSWKSKELIFRNCLVGNELPLHLLFCGF